MNNRPSLQEITQICADAFGVSTEELLTKKDMKQPGHRKAKLVAPRHIGYLMCREAGYSWMDIARYMGVDHTSVMYGARNIRDFEMAAPVWKIVLGWIRKQVKDGDQGEVREGGSGSSSRGNPGRAGQVFMGALPDTFGTGSPAPQGPAHRNEAARNGGEAPDCRSRSLPGEASDSFRSETGR